MKKTTLLMLLSLVLLATSAGAVEFSAQNAYNWLAAKSANGSIGNDVIATSWSVLAFNGAGLTDQAESSLGWLFSQQTSDFCFPSPNCKTMDTSLAILAMNGMQRLDNTTQIEAKLKDMLIASNLEGQWAIEASPLTTAGGKGDCKISWIIDDELKEKTVAYDSGKFPQYGNGYFLNIEDLQSGLIRNHPGLKINVDCSAIEGSMTISLIYKFSNKFYILSSQEGNKADVIVNNGCFGAGPSDSGCRKDSTLYAGWAASAINSDIDTKIYMMEKYDPESVTDNALLSLSTKTKDYAEKLKSLQKMDGSFDRSMMGTALAILALKSEAGAYSAEITKATDWLKARQKTDGSFGTASETAAVLYAAFGGEAIDMPPETINEPPGGVECGDEFCDDAFGEDSDTCPEDCEDSTTDSNGGICIEDGVCDNEYGETKDNCENDCKCGDSICDDAEDEDGSCPEDCPITDDTDKNAAAACGDGACDSDEDIDSCPEDCSDQKTGGGAGFGTWILILLIVLAIVGGGYMAVKKGVFKKKQGPKPLGGLQGYSFKPRAPIVPSSMQQQKPVQRPSMQVRPSFGGMSKSKDDELAKSIEEAKKLLQK